MNLSIIIPHYNRSSLLEILLKSIPKNHDIQTIVVDDKSDLFHLEVIKQLKKNTPKSFKKSSEILSRCVSLPIFCKMNQNLVDTISLSIRKTLS